MTSNLSSLFANAKKVALVSVPVREVIETAVVEKEISERPTKKLKQSEIEEDEDPLFIHAETVFVGNVPGSCTQKELKKLFSEFGTVQSVRLRNLIPLHAKRGKRLAFIKQEFHPLQKTITAFVRFADRLEAQSATSLNGYLYKEHHLRVDMAHDQHDDVKHDNKRSLFIGNLPFDVNDDDVWKIFEECGEVEGVRLVRDRATSVGKGFGYVLFKDEASVALALRMNGNCRIANREIRIKPAVKKPKPGKGRPVVSNKFHGQSQRKPTSRTRDEDHVGIEQGRVGKRPAVQLKKELQKKKKRKLMTKTNDTRKDVIQMKKRT